MKILVLNGSPKREKSDVMHITRAFLDGMGAANTVRVINAIDAHIEYCTGCFSCMRNGGSCVHNDDMKWILDEILGSDLLILSFPLYCYALPAPLKALIDRTLPLSSMAMQKSGDHYEHVAQADFSRLSYVMISGCGFPNSTRNFEPAVAAFKLMFPLNHTVITVPESPMFNAPEAAAVTEPRLNLVREAGRHYAQSGTIPAELLAQISSPMISEDEYARIVNGGMGADKKMKKNIVLYIHGKGGSAAEDGHYKQLFPESDCLGLDYKASTPWEASAEIHEAIAELKARYDTITLIANSIGAFFAMNADIGEMIDKAFFISPVVDMEAMIRTLMASAGVSEAELREHGTIASDFGEDLSWEYLCYVRSHPLRWAVPTEILYGSNDSLTSRETITAFSRSHGASLTVMDGGEHWFHTAEQMRFLDEWIKNCQ